MDSSDTSDCRVCLTLLFVTRTDKLDRTKDLWQAHPPLQWCIEGANGKSAASKGALLQHPCSWGMSFLHGVVLFAMCRFSHGPRCDLGIIPAPKSGEWSMHAAIDNPCRHVYMKRNTPCGKRPSVTDHWLETFSYDDSYFKARWCEIGNCVWLRSRANWQRPAKACYSSYWRIHRRAQYMYMFEYLCWKSIWTKRLWFAILICRLWTVIILHTCTSVVPDICCKHQQLSKASCGKIKQNSQKTTSSPLLVWMTWLHWTWAWLQLTRTIGEGPCSFQWRSTSAIFKLWGSCPSRGLWMKTVSTSWVPIPFSIGTANTSRWVFPLYSIQCLDHVKIVK